ncbi:MAG: hypothetical protein ACOY0T_06725 [Myxococcota bacterium]
MPTKHNLAHPKPQDQVKHPEPWATDLNPNGATETPAAHPHTRPASTLKTLPQKLPEFSYEELEQIPVVVPGSRLKARAVYVDLHDPNRREFTAGDNHLSSDGHAFIPKAEVPYELWNRLVGRKRSLRFS